MTTFHLDLEPVPDASDSDLRALSVRVGHTVLTRLLRDDANQPADSVCIPATPLAFWLADNWWRLRHECRPSGRPSPDWWQSHEMTGIGRGYAWPRIQLWGESDRIAVISRANPAGAAGPVRFLQDALMFVSAAPFERSIDSVLDQVCEIASGQDQEALRALVARLREERADSQLADWRRLEAIAGFDPDEAPETLMEGLSALTQRFDVPDIEEITAADPGPGAATTIGTILEDSAMVPIKLDIQQLMNHRVRGLQGSEPWQQAEASAALTRELIGDAEEPLRNRRLAELVGVSKQILAGRPARPGRPLPYGLRVRDGERTRILVQSHWGQDRRFEVARTLGDAIWSKNSALGPVSRAATARQKFQRAFAASLLCPPAALQAYIGTDTPSDEDISAAARHYHVADRVVRSILVNKRLMHRERLEPPFPTLTDRDSIEDLADAA